MPAKTRCLAGVALSVLLLVCPATTAAEPAFSGAVKDVLGNVLAEVEVLVIMPSSVAGEVLPVATVRTDDAGRFLIQQLDGGSYQIAAIKRGYRTYIGQVDTQVDRWVQLVLYPQSSAEAAGVPIPEDSSWALRLPRRNILRDEGLVVARLEPEPPSRPTFSELPVTLRVDQLFKVATDLQLVPGDDSVVQGTQTHVNVGADLGRRGRVSIDGMLERLADSKFFDGSAPTARDRDQVHVGMVYETSVDSRVSADVDYSKNEARWEPRDGVPPAVDHEQATVLGRVAYDQQFGPATKMTLAADWAVSEMTFPAITPGATPNHGSIWNNRSFGGSGNIKRVGASGRRLEIDFDVRHFDPSSAGLRATDRGPVSAFDGMEGWTAGVHAREARDLSENFSLVYGVGYRRAMSGDDAALFTPQVGGRLDLESLQFDWVATVFSVQGERWQPQKTVGYETELEVPFGDNVSMSVAHEFTPVLGDRLDRRPAELVAMVFVTDGNAALERSRLALYHRTAAVHLVAAVSRGSIDGSVAAVLPYDLSFQELADRNLDYRSGMVGLRFLEQGTLVTLDLIDVQESRQAMPMADSSHRSVGLTLSQDLPRREELGRWRFLMGLSMDDTSSGDPDDLRQIATTERLETTDARLSAGLSLEF